DPSLSDTLTAALAVHERVTSAPGIACPGSAVNFAMVTGGVGAKAMLMPCCTVPAALVASRMNWVASVGVKVIWLPVTGPGAGQVGLPAVGRAGLGAEEGVGQVDQVLPVDAAVEVGVARAAHAGRVGAGVGADLPEAAAVGGGGEPLRLRGDADVGHLHQRER